MSLYCKIYLDTDLSKDKVLELIAQITSGRSQMRTVSSAHCEIDVVLNEDFDDEKKREEEDGFLFYPYYLDVEPANGAVRERYVESIGQLLEGLWNSGCRAIAACDFESELSKSGGYKASAGGASSAPRKGVPSRS
jgi:hypothetical protein